MWIESEAGRFGQSTLPPQQAAAGDASIRVPHEKHMSSDAMLWIESEAGRFAPPALPPQQPAAAAAPSLEDDSLAAVVEAAAAQMEAEVQARMKREAARAEAMLWVESEAGRFVPPVLPQQESADDLAPKPPSSPQQPLRVPRRPPAQQPPPSPQRPHSAPRRTAPQTPSSPRPPPSLVPQRPATEQRQPVFEVKVDHFASSGSNMALERRIKELEDERSGLLHTLHETEDHVHDLELQLHDAMEHLQEDTSVMPLSVRSIEEQEEGDLEESSLVSLSEQTEQTRDNGVTKPGHKLSRRRSFLTGHGRHSTRVPTAEAKHGDTDQEHGSTHRKRHFHLHRKHGGKAPAADTPDDDGLEEESTTQGSFRKRHHRHHKKNAGAHTTFTEIHPNVVDAGKALQCLLKDEFRQAVGHDVHSLHNDPPLHGAAHNSSTAEASRRKIQEGRKNIMSSLGLRPDARSRPLPGTHPDYPFENIVLKGGGAKGAIYPGAIAALEEKGIMRYMKRFAGASAGALAAALLAIGLTSEQLTAELNSVDIQELVQDGKHGKLSTAVHLFKELGVHPANKLFDFIGHLFVKYLGTLSRVA